MATYYWVGGGAMWSSFNSSSWSLTSGGAGGAGIPTSTDNVIFNSSSGSGTCYFDSGVICNNLTIQSGCPIDFQSTNYSNPVEVYGNMTVASGITFGSGSAFLYFYSATAVLNCASPLLGFYLEVPSGTNLTLANNLVLDTTSQGIEVLSGSTFNAAGYTITLYEATVQANCTLSGGTIYSFLSVSNNANLILTSGTTTTVVGNFTMSSGTTLNSTTPGSRATISKASGTVTFTGVTVKDNAATGGATFNADINGGNNTGWIFTATPTNPLYWVGGSGTWSATANTQFSTSSGGAPVAFDPTPTNPVIVDANSGSPNIALSGALVCASLTTTGATCTFSSTGTLTVSGDITLSSTTTWSGTGLLALDAASTITAGSTTFACSISSSVSVTLGANLTLGTANTFTFTGGTLSLSTFTLSTGLFSSNTGTRVFAFGTGDITTTGSGSALTIVGTSLTYTGTPTINVSNNSATATTVTLSTGFTETNALSVNYTTGTYTLTNTGAVYKNLNLTGFAGTFPNTTKTIYGNFTCPATGGTYTAGTAIQTLAATSGTQVITTNGRTLDFPFTQSGNGGTVQLAGALTLGTSRTYVHTNGTLNLNNFTLSTGLYTCSTTTNPRAIQFGTTGNITTTGSGTVINILGLRFTYTGTSAINVSNNSATATTVGLTSTFTETNALNVNFTTGTYSATISNNSVFKSLNFTGFAGTWASGTSSYVFSGSLTLVSGMTYTTPTGGLYTFANTSGTATFTSAGKTLYNITKSGAGGTLAFSGATTLSNQLAITAGTLQLPAGVTTTVGSFVTSGTTLKYLTSSIPGTQATLSDASGTNTVTYLSIQDSNATGGAVFNAFLASNNVNAGNNTGWIFTAPVANSNFFLLFA